MINRTANLFPDFENDFLTDVVFSLRKRRKSLKHQVHDVTCDKVYEVDGDQRTEKLEIGIQESFSVKDIRLRLHAWPDRWIWVDARKAAKHGWEWEWTYEGRLLGDFTGRDLIAAIEKSLFYSSGSTPPLSDVSKVWQPLLAKGPVSVD